jgi:two-component system chemotaxis response regulator CheY
VAAAKRILIIDDSLIVRQQVSSTLKQAGYEVIEAINGQDGQKQIQSIEGLSLIICDVNMPIINGLEMIEDLAHRGITLPCPIVMLTSEAQPEPLAKAKRLGVRAWMVKPVKPLSLLTLVRRIAV